ncbi:MAG: hypothetical protein M1819_004969 [Sarea resinae]|nr:MAG: hypothetical protein M1819_004969 [Sarea resinae]
METLNIPELVERLGSDEDAVRKMAVFKLQSNIADPSFADIFIAEGGLTKLRFLALHASGNTLAYCLTSLSRLLEVDMGWDYVNQELVDRVVELVVTHPLVNILRGAMSILVAVVSHPHTSGRSPDEGVFGFRALKPSFAEYPQFLEMLVSRLSSADHALCANALQLINSLMRDAIMNEEEAEWPKFIKRIQDLGVIKAVYQLMQSTALQDLAHPILEFQALTKILLRKWRDVRVDLEKPDHRRALKGLHLASNPERPEKAEGDDLKRSRRHNPEKWRRLGFRTESPALDFEEVGFLGMMDLTDFVRKHEDGFQKLLLEQSTLPPEQRCPIARASLSVTLILYEHFEVENSDIDDAKSYLALESRTNYDKVFRPLLLQWSRLHTSGLQAFLRLWKATFAEIEDFDKVEELVRILIEQVVGQASRTKEVQEVEDEIAEHEYARLRELQMELLELTYEDTWGHHLRQVREELNHEALQFIKEQRIRCILQGAWFPNSTAPSATSKSENANGHITGVTAGPWRYVRLSHNRRYLHYADFERHEKFEPALDMLPEKIDLSIVSSVVSNISTSASSHSSASSASSSSTIKTHPPNHPSSHPSHPHNRPSTTTTITIHGYLPPSHPFPQPPGTASKESAQKESTLLTLHPSSHTVASEWLDALLMLLNQRPITAETNKLVKLISEYGLRIRLLNVRFDGLGFGEGEDGYGEDGREGGDREVPSREGLDEDYWYDVFGGL